MLKKLSYWLLIILLLLVQHSFAQQTEKVYLSGTGSDHTVKWDFFCTDGMSSSKWTTIDVPSCWELQGFGKYNYGLDKDSVKGKEHGLYKHKFNVPDSWNGKQINIVFEGVMTDAEVKINGKIAGPIHQGAFYAFKYNITSLLHYGKENLLEVEVSKYSANNSVNAAERRGDFWIFGGIFRPVWLEVLPPVNIASVAIDAKADGDFNALLYKNGEPESASVKIYSSDGKLVGEASTPNEMAILQFGKTFPGILPWSPESPNLYTAIFKIYNKGELVHTVTKRFGFRTIEVKPHDGIYVNGIKVKLKGVCRHSFRPETGRTLSKLVSIEDVNLIKDMNMNAVRMSHYPPDDHFLDVCDSLGLFVLDELAGWHGNYDTPTGKKLVKEMVLHDQNHPSVIFWDNGNEGGFNFDLDSLFTTYDIQKRTVIHPWALFGNINTMHYRQFNYGIGDYNHGREIVMPTEFLHGWFDGGHGAGLEDYWEAMWHDPLAAGGFLWDFADEGVVRHDLHDSIDTDKFHGADGIMGPHLEKEGSFYAIKEIWSPIQFEKKEITEAFDGKLNIENRFFFTNITQCHFTWRLKRINSLDLPEERRGKAASPDIKPSDHGVLQIPLPIDWRQFGVLYVTATDPSDRELFTWSFPIVTLLNTVNTFVPKTGNDTIHVSTKDSVLQVHTRDIHLSFNINNGILLAVKNERGDLPFNNGPIIQEGDNNFKDFKHYFDGRNYIIASTFDRKNSYNTLQWTIYPSGWVKMDVHYFPNAMYTNFDGVNFSLPEREWKSFNYLGNGPYRAWKNRMRGGMFENWEKKYNNTETGESPWIYPEFKGYYSNVHSCHVETKSNQFTFITETPDLFLRVLTPAWKTDQWHNYEPYFPSGDISFMNGIPSIGSKSQTAESTGPMGEKNIYYDYGHDPSRALHIVLYFNFSVVQ